jgi:tetratricopeptide (TPR) repeat protein
LKPFEYFKRTGHHPILFEGSCNSLANVNFELHNYEEAFSIFNTGYQASLKTGNYYFRIYALDGMGKIKMLENKLEEAKEYYQQALEEAERSKSSLHISNALTELAVFSYKTNDLVEAEQLNKQALAIREQENLTGAAVTNSVNLGEIYIKQSRWNEALEVLGKALEMAEQTKVKPKMYQVRLLLSKVYKGMGNMEQSLYHYEIFHELREKVQEEDSARKLTDAKLIFEAEQTRKENIIIKKQKQEIENKNHQLQETIDELTITKISRKARGITLLVGIVLIVAEEPIFHYVLTFIGEENLLLSILAKVVVILSLKPIDKAIESYLLRGVVLKRRKHLQEKNKNNSMENETAIAV